MMVRTYHKWKGHAKDLLFNYGENKKQLRIIEGDIIYGSNKSYDGMPSPSGVGRPTERRAIRLTSNRVSELKREVETIAALVSRLESSERPDDKDKLALLRLVYFDHTHSLYGAALEIGVSESTIWRYNAKILELIGTNMGWL